MEFTMALHITHFRECFQFVWQFSYCIQLFRIIILCIDSYREERVLLFLSQSDQSKCRCYIFLLQAIVASSLHNYGRVYLNSF